MAFDLWMFVKENPDKKNIYLAGGNSSWIAIKRKTTDHFQIIKKSICVK